MKLNHDEQVLCDFMTLLGKVNGSIDYPLILLANWITVNDDDEMIHYDKKQEVIEAYNNCLVNSGLDKPLYLAIKKIKGWK